MDGNPTCDRCDLCRTATHVCIPGRCVRDTGGSEAVLIVGESPGTNEDREGRVFIGRSGKVLEKSYVSRLPEDVDVWATNSVKCTKPYGGDIKTKNIKACQQYLVQDIEELNARYSHVWVLCVGKPAVEAVTGAKKLKAAFDTQDRLVTVIAKTTLTKPVRVFATYHPAFLMRNLNRATGAVIEDHLAMMKERMAGPDKSAVVVRVGVGEFLKEVGGKSPVCVDIETYGIWKGKKQTQFNPMTCLYVDGVPFRDQVVSVAFGVERGEEIVTTAVDFKRGAKEVERVLWRTGEVLAPLLGTMLLYDVTFLSSQFPRWVIPEKQQLWELMAFSFLQNPDRPEKSLKAIAPLLLPGEEMAKYGPRGTQYTNMQDILNYNVQDVVNPLLALRVIEGRIREHGYPQDMEFMREYYSQLVKELLYMQKTGVCLDAKAIERMEEKVRGRIEKLVTAAEKVGFQLRGKGSGKVLDRLFEEVVGEQPTAKWELTEKEKKISTGLANIKRAAHVRLSRGVARKVRVLKKFRDADKLHGSYLEGLRRLTEKTPIVYPQWFPVPSSFVSSDGSFDFGGGTRQMRITCQRPALMTSPKKVKQTIRSRYGGALVWWDYSQMEMRYTALASGDGNLMRVFEEGRDIHHETLCRILGREVDKGEKEYERDRRKAKYTNFGIVYGITAPMLVKALWKFAEVDMEEGEAVRFIWGFKRGYPGVPLWQEALLEEVRRTGKLVLPVTGHWLPFADPRMSKLDKAIFNFPVQGPCAVAALEAQKLLRREVERRKVGCVPIQIYDSIGAETRLRRKDAEEFAMEMKPMLERHWFFRALWDHYGREVKFPVDIKVIGG